MRDLNCSGSTLDIGVCSVCTSLIESHAIDFWLWNPNKQLLRSKVCKLNQYWKLKLNLALIKLTSFIRQVAMSINKCNYVIMFCNHGTNTRRKWNRLGPYIIYSPLVWAQANLCHRHSLKSLLSTPAVEETLSLKNPAAARNLDSASCPAFKL